MMANPFNALEGLGDIEFHPAVRPTPSGNLLVTLSKSTNRLAGRSWLPGLKIDESFGFRIVSYNVLAQCYAKQRHFTNCKLEHLAWGFRRKALLELLIELDADILCLQEIDNYDKFWRPHLGRLGYCGIYKQRNHHTKRDGCATFYRASRFELIRHDALEFDHVPSCRHVEGAPDFATHNIAQLSLFVVAGMARVPSNVLSCLCVVNVHLFWDPGYENLKIAQAKAAVQAADELSRSIGTSAAAPIILAGDFNSMPCSEVYKFLTSEAGFVSAYMWGGLYAREPKRELIETAKTAPPALSKPVAVGSIVLSKGFNPDSPEFRPSSMFCADASLALPASAEERLVHPAEPCFTNYRDNFNGTIDYILIRNPSQDSSTNTFKLEVLNILSMIAASEAAAEGGGLPSSQHPSDHLPIAATLRLSFPTPPTPTYRRRRQPLRNNGLARGGP